MRYLIFLLFFCPFLVAAQSNTDRREEFGKLAWQRGPMEARIGDKATIAVPEGFVFLDAANTRRFLELNGNPPRDGHYMFASGDGNWWSVFTFTPSGYVKDDEKIDADALLKSLKDADEPGNAERKRLGMEAIYTDGWQVPPHYDTQSRRLEWAVRARTAGGERVANYTTRLLGRSGVMSATLVTDPNELATHSEQFKVALQGFNYVAGERYSEFKSGDKIAQYGLAALIVGGAAAIATKKGFWAAIVAFFAAFWKLIAGVAVVALAGLGKIFGRKKQ